MISAHCAGVSESSAGPLFTHIFNGYPRFATILSSTLTTRCAGIFRTISIASASRLKSSTTLKVLEASATHQRIVHKIDGPALVHRLWCRQRSRIAHRQALFSLTAKIQFQLAVFILKIFHLFNIGGFYTTKLCFPVVIAGSENTGCAAGILNGASGFDGLQNGDDLKFGESGFAHNDLLQEHNQYAGRSLNVNGPVYRDGYSQPLAEFFVLG